MLVRLTGIWDDGTPRAAWLPATAARTLAFPTGADVTVQVDIVSNAGVAVDTSTASATLTVKQSSLAQPVLALVGVQPMTPVRGRLFFAVPRNLQNKGILPGRYVYDVWLTIGAVRNPVIPLSPLALQPAVGLP